MMIQARISAFYGYKGGLGRSFTLAHVAWLLARGYGRNVLVIDADLEAPGLGDFFRLTSGFDRTWRQSKGLIDLIYSYADTFSPEELKKRFDTDKVFKLVEEGGKYLHRISEGAGERGTINFLGPGQLRSALGRTPDETPVNYFDNVISSDWSEFYHEPGMIFFKNLGDVLRRQGWNDVLIDMRTGLSQSSAKTIAAMADNLVLFAGANFQSLDGLGQMKKWLERERRNLIEGELKWPLRPFRTAAILSRLEPGRIGALTQQLFERDFPDDDNANESHTGEVANTRVIVPYVTGIQQEDLFAKHERPFVERLGEIAAWLAFPQQDLAANGRSLACLPEPQGLKDQQQDTDPASSVNQLIADGRKVLTGSKVVMSNFDIGQPQSSPSSGDASALLETERDALRHRYAKLKLIEAALFDRRVADPNQPDAEPLQRLFGIEPSDKDWLQSSDSRRDDSSPTPISTPKDMAELRLRLHKRLIDKVSEITRLCPSPHEGSTTGDADLAQHAADLIGRGAFLEDADAFKRGMRLITKFAKRAVELKPPDSWTLGYSLVAAAEHLRSLGGDDLAFAEQLLQSAWQAGALSSSGDPPPPHETSGLITYAFLLSASGRVDAGRETLCKVNEAVTKHFDRVKGTAIYANLQRNYELWKAAMSLRERSGAVLGGVDRGVAGPLARVNPDPLNKAERVSLDGWLTTALRWRGDPKRALEAAERRLQGLLFHDWSGEPPRVQKLRILTDKAELELLLGRHKEAAESLAAAAGWAEARSELFENLLIPFRLKVALLQGLGCERTAAHALDLVEDAGLFEKAAAAAGINTTDLTLRYPALVRAALTAVRLRSDRADELIGRCESVLSQPSVMLENAWGDELRYLFECARKQRHGHGGAQAALDAACQRVAGNDGGVVHAAALAFCGLADLWLLARPSTLS